MENFNLKGKITLMRRVLFNRIEKSFLHIKQSVVFNTNEEFEKLTGYCRNDLIGKTLLQVNAMLKIASQVCIEDIVRCCCYIFNKKFEPIYVVITCHKLSSKEQIFYFKEKKIYKIPNSPCNTSPLLKYEVGVGTFSVPSGILLKHNKKYTEFINKKGNFLGKNYKEILPRSNDTNVENIFTNAIETGKSFYIKENKYENSSKYWGESIKPIYFKGELKYVVHTVHDITDKIKLREITKENEKLKTIIENAYEEIIIVNDCGNFIDVNKIAKNIAGVSSVKEYEDYFKNSEFLYIKGGPIDHIDLPVEKIVKNKSINKQFLEIKNKSMSRYKEINGNTIYDTNGNFSFGVISMRDITDYINSIDSILISTQHDILNGIIDNFGLGYLRFSYPDLIIREYNKKLCNDMISKNSKLSSTIINGIKLTEIFPENHTDIFVNFINEVVKDKILRSMNMKVFNKPESKTLKMLYQPLLGIDGQVSEIAVITVDVTAEVNDKEKMEKSLKVQDEIFANVSHEIKTPISVIYSANQMIDMYIKNNIVENKDKIYEYNSIIKQNCFRLIRLVNNIVDLTKGNSGFLHIELNNVNIVKVVENIVQSVKIFLKYKDLKIFFETDVEEKIIACDTNKIERVLLNLISNAIKFSDSKGKIYVNVFDRGNAVEIAVKDEGIGIECEHMDYLFQNFYQADKSLSRKAEGTGIGLPLIKNLVELHGGIISVESEVGKGSIFRVILPSKTIEKTSSSEKINYFKNKDEMVNIEFSDIYT